MPGSAASVRPDSLRSENTWSSYGPVPPNHDGGSPQDPTGAFRLWQAHDKSGEGRLHQLSLRRGIRRDVRRDLLRHRLLWLHAPECAGIWNGRRIAHAAYRRRDFFFEVFDPRSVAVPGRRQRDARPVQHAPGARDRDGPTVHEEPAESATRLAGAGPGRSWLSEIRLRPRGIRSSPV